MSDENNPSGAVEEILSQPDKLSDLDLDAFAEELERQDYGNKKITLYDIRNELFAPFKERREAYSPMTEVNLPSLVLRARHLSGSAFWWNSVCLSRQCDGWLPLRYGNSGQCGS